jgi:hypothetical protein
MLGVVGGLKGVFLVRYGSGRAEKWTSVSPCTSGAAAAAPAPCSKSSATRAR